MHPFFFLLAHAGMEQAPQTGWDHFVEWIGHFHPAMTVFPIGLLLAAVIAELLFLATKAPWLDGAARFCVIIAAIGGAITAPLGWAFAKGHGHSWVLETHRWLGTAGAVWLIALLIVSEVSRRRPGGWRTVFLWGLFLAAPAVMAIGYFGGAMVYGLNEYAWNQHTEQHSEDHSSDAASQSPGTQPSNTTPGAIVNMTDKATFDPSNVTINVGQTVRWINSSTDEHTVTDDAKRATDAKDISIPPSAKPFDSGKIQPGKTFEHTFTVPGTYKYVCHPHEDMGMTGQVIVKSAP